MKAAYFAVVAVGTAASLMFSVMLLIACSQAATTLQETVTFIGAFVMALCGVSLVMVWAEEQR